MTFYFTTLCLKKFKTHSDLVFVLFESRLIEKHVFNIVCSRQSEASITSLIALIKPMCLCGLLIIKSIRFLTLT
jgi:hypothetical protein